MLTFKELNLDSGLMKAITELGFEAPTPIQAQALPALLKAGTDCIGLAATGTGKTAAFAIPLLQRLIQIKSAAGGSVAEGASLIKKGKRFSTPNVQALILCPTRELAMQVSGQINLLGKYVGLRSLPVYGGSSYGDQIRGLKEGAPIVVGTPGRVVDHLERGTLKLDGLKTLILDEADEMISMGFKDDLETILKLQGRWVQSVDRKATKVPNASGELTLEGVMGSEDLGSESHIWLFSATMSREVRKVADQYLESPYQIQVNQAEMLPTLVEQIYYRVHESDKPEVLCKLIDAAEAFYGLVFCQTKALVVDLTHYLKGRGYQADCLHGDMDQTARERTMKAFRERKVTVLVCTDVASRGLDVKDISHVVNYSIPRELDSYVHRIGRTARSGKSGFAMSLVTPSHRVLVGRIEKMTKSKMIEGKIPSRRDIGAKKISLALASFKAQESHSRATALLDSGWKEALDTMKPHEIAGRFLSILYPEVFSEKQPDHEASFAGPPASNRDRQDYSGAKRFPARRQGGGRPQGQGQVVVSRRAGPGASGSRPRPNGYNSRRAPAR